MNLPVLLAAILAALVLAGLLFARWWLARARSSRGPRSTHSPSRTMGPPDSEAAERVRQDIETRVQSLRRARERAERWVPPAADVVQSRPGHFSGHGQDPDWADTSFADTSFPDDEPPLKRS